MVIAFFRENDTKSHNLFAHKFYNFDDILVRVLLLEGKKLISFLIFFLFFQLLWIYQNMATKSSVAWFHHWSRYILWTLPKLNSFTPKNQIAQIFLLLL